MKKVFLFAVAAATLVACSESLNYQEETNLNTKDAPINFDVYTQRAVTRGGTAGTNDNVNIGTRGFGVFAYYTAGEGYDTKATPNFMYNQKVTAETSETNPATAGVTKWTYEPVKYWPNEYGNNASSDEVDYVTFFAYAPWTDIDPITGNVKVPEAPTTLTTPEQKKEWQKHYQSYNIISVNKNTATGDPLVKYVVDTDPATSVDLLWGVASKDAAASYSGIIESTTPYITEGMPFLSLVKPNEPATDLLSFNLKHALAKVKVTIDYIADDYTPTGSSALINQDQTRIFVRHFKMSGFATKGALNLNNTTPGEPLWKDFDGVKDLAFDEVTFQDGRKDGKEGETNGAQSNESPQGLNPQIVENYAQVTDGKFASTKNPGVTKDPQLLFGGTQTVSTDNGFFYVIPRNEEGGKVDITIAYDVETIDPALAGKISDGETHGISIENIISKTDIFGGLDFKAGYQYEINIHLGMTSVKVEATVTEWVNNGQHNVDLPDNQQPAAVTAANYVYPAPNAYNYKGTIKVVDGNTVTYTPGTGADQDDMKNDMARFLGALHRAAGVKEIEYSTSKYTWNPAVAMEISRGTGETVDPNKTELVGSNWVSNATPPTTLVHDIVAAASSLTTSLTLKADGEEITINFPTQQP